MIPEGAYSKAGLDAATAIERGCSVMTVGMDRAMGEPLVRPTPAPQPADLFKRDLVVPKAAHPAPLIGARDANEVEIPSAARKVRTLAEANGWRVRPTYALGWVLGARGETRALTHSLALRMMRQEQVGGPARHIVALWVVKEPDQGLLNLKARGVTEIPVPGKGWKFDLAYTWGMGDLFSLSAVALAETIKGE
jgi:hypothetical protein